MAMEGNLTLGNEHAMQYTYVVLLNYTLDTYNFINQCTPINLIKKKLFQSNKLWLKIL